MKKIARHVVKLHTHKKKCKTVEEHSLISPHHPLSDAQQRIRSHPVVVPKGSLAVYVGQHHRRFLIPTTLLSAPDFKAVMDRAAEEFGYQQEGGLRIPCEEEDFEKLLAVCKFKAKANSQSLPS